MTPDQVRAARDLLGWSRRQLGAHSGTSVHVVKVLEQDGRAISVHRRMEQVAAEATIRATLEAAGIEFTDGDTPGVRLRVAQGTEAE